MEAGALVLSPAALSVCLSIPLLRPMNFPSAVLSFPALENPKLSNYPDGQTFIGEKQQNL